MGWVSSQFANVSISEPQRNSLEIILSCRSVPPRVGACPCVDLACLDFLISTTKPRLVRVHRESGLSYDPQSAYLHNTGAYGGGFGVAVSPGRHWGFAVLSMGNPFGVWAAQPFSEAHQTSPPCLSSNSNIHIASIQWFRYADIR